MNYSEKELLKTVVNFHSGLLSPAEMFNTVGQHQNEKEIHKLITEGFIEEVPTTRNERSYIFYRATQKGHMVFEPILKKGWIFLRDLKNLSTILSIIATILSIVSIIISLKNNG